MPFRDQYRDQVALAIRILPLVAQEECFALKGGTAINLFVRNMPRLSVDIDLTYLPVQPRPESLAAIEAAMAGIAARVKKSIAGVHVAESRLRTEGTLTRLSVRAGTAQTKIEVTPVLRGCVYAPELRGVASAVENAFGFVKMQVVSFADLYAGKMVAALDRQHPRDFFDVRDLFANEGIDDALRRAFLVYLLSHDRPMHTVLKPTLKDISGEFARGFDGMTEEPLPIKELYATRDGLIREAVAGMPDAHRRFLSGFLRGAPDWTLLGVPGAQDLPAVKWRQQNLDRLSAPEREALAAQVAEVFSA
jgi:predicted nucleotidyltransferase component of viral defense system